MTVLVVLAFSRCESEPRHGFTLSATSTFVDAAVLLDGRPIGQLQHLKTPSRLFDAVLAKIYGDAPAFDVVAVNVDLSDRTLSPGIHRLRVEKQGLPAAEGTFVYPFSGDDWQHFAVYGAAIEAPDVQ